MQHSEGYSLLDRDWDTAILLDDCRYDTFREQNIIEGDLSKETSPGGNSRSYFEQTFDGRQCHDIVYVTGNPHVATLDSNTFHEVLLDEAWDTETKDVPPGQLTDLAIDAHEKYPNKRIIVHYMQPHLPVLHPDYQQVNRHIWHWKSQYWPIGISEDELREGYQANLDLVLSEVQNLLEEIKGKVVITADHGELLGERERPIPIRSFAHHDRLNLPPLRDVPWLVVDSEKRRTIREETPDEEEGPEFTDQEKRLEALRHI